MIQLAVKCKFEKHTFNRENIFLAVQKSQIVKTQS